MSEEEEGKFKRTEITDPGAKQRILMDTKLDIMLSATDADCFHAAHKNDHSYFVLRIREDPSGDPITIYLVENGTKQDRKNVADNIRKELEDKFNGKTGPIL